MHDIASMAERLRLVREARLRFLGLWAAECLVDQDQTLDRLLLDIMSRQDEPLADPDNHDWSLMYRGSVLDD